MASLSFLSPTQMDDSWRLYSAPFHEETPHYSRIRLNRQTGDFLYDTKFMMAEDLSFIADVHLEHLSIHNALKLASITGPDYSRMKSFSVDSTTATNFSALASAAMLEELILYETPIMNMDFLDGMDHLERIHLLGVPIHNSNPICNVMERHDPAAPALYVSISRTLIPGFSRPELPSTLAHNVFLENDGSRLPLSYVIQSGWGNLLEAELLRLCAQDE